MTWYSTLFHFSSSYFLYEDCCRKNDVGKIFKIEYNAFPTFKKKKKFLKRSIVDTALGAWIFGSLEFPLYNGIIDIRRPNWVIKIHINSKLKPTENRKGTWFGRGWRIANILYNNDSNDFMTEVNFSYKRNFIIHKRKWGIFYST